MTEDISYLYTVSEMGMKSYLARAVVNFMLKGDIKTNAEEGQTFCQVS